MQFEFDLLFTTSEKILDKIFGYDFTLEKPTVYDYGKNIGQDVGYDFENVFTSIEKKQDRAIWKVLINEKLLLIWI